MGVSTGGVGSIAGEGIGVGLDTSIIAAGGGFSYGYGLDKSFGGMTFTLNVELDSSAASSGISFAASTNVCTTTAQVVKYSQSLASVEINPYYYDAADTCRKVKLGTSNAIYLVIDRTKMHITGAFWNTWISDKSHEVLPSLAMFTTGRRLHTAESRLVIDSATGEPFLISYGMKHWIGGKNTVNRCGFDLSKATTEDLNTFDMGKVISLDANNQIYQCQLV